MPVIAVVVAAVLLAALCSYFIRNTSGVHPTNRPGAMAGNLAMAFIVLVVLGIGILALIAAAR